ncbi:MAG TPA: hypothetical protein DEA26_03270 [Oceanospirillales bacterium]|nr:hypothetical protein [Oceanospirillaceae bacterium]HBS41674.1 hypothetical protein [Oceanospirillales bacterium]|tara:strand:- start:1674 stop:2240 length:567 start_codon:yes stop_codon:yes gene_type:complete
MTTGIILLAAGRSQRFGSDKRCTPWPGQECMFRTSLTNAVQSGLPVFVVLHPGDSDILNHCVRDEVQASICPDADKGIGNSIAYGVHTNQDWSGWIIARADMPFVTPGIYRQLAASLKDHDCARLADRMDHCGFPTALRREHAFNLMHLNGHVTEESLLKGHDCARISVDDPIILRDVNFPSDIPEAV